MRPKGSPFFVSLPSETVDDRSHVYLVTAKHVATAVQGRQFLARVNTKQGGSVFVRGEDVRWWFHPTDELADVAVLPWAPPDFVE